MIRMVVSDVDGTLLKKGEEKISRNILNLIEELKKKGIIFAVASGRHLSEIKRIFDNQRDIYYIASDGGCIEYNNDIIYYKPIADYIINMYKDKDDYILQCSMYVYYNGGDLKLKSILEEKYGDNLKSIEKAANIVKIVKYGSGFSETPPCTYEVYKDKDWREWINNGVSKGKAIEFLQNRENVKVMETAAFGDNFNDMSMMRTAGEKFCKNNSPAAVKMMCKKTFSNIEEELFKIGGQNE